MSSPTKITVALGDIVRQSDCDAVVNAANNRLRAGSGVCGAIHAAAGPSLEPFASALGPIPTGSAVITPSFLMQNRWIIHAVGPKYLQDQDPPLLLAQAMMSIVRLAETNSLSKVAVPAISTGVYGYPIEEAAPVLVKSARDATRLCSRLKEIRFVLTSQAALEVFQGAIDGYRASPVITRRLIETIRDRYALNWNGTHGVSHWSRVRLNGLEIARHTGADANVVELFAFLHDSCRENESKDPLHGPRAAKFIETLQGKVLDLTPEQLACLVESCEGHSGGQKARNSTIATCWDADRLDLWRIGIRPEAHRLLTPAAKDPQMIAAALARVKQDVEPSISA